MYLMYVDESGDPGLVGSPKRYFILSGVVVHESKWRPVIERLVEFRRRMKGLYGMPQTVEFHAAQLMARTGKHLSHIPKHHRLGIVRAYVSELAQIQDLRLINVVVDKQSKPPGFDVYEVAWKALIQRFENTLNAKNFPGGSTPPDMGAILPDDGQTDRLRHLLRKMRAYNPIPTRYPSPSGYLNLPLRHVIEDPLHRDSRHSYYVQSADLVSWVLQQHLDPSVFVKKRSGQNYFQHLAPICLRQASPGHSQGVVML
jgi:hypothetical protein